MKTTIKDKVEVGEYSGKRPYIGWITPTQNNAQWVIFLKDNGDAVYYSKRDKNGAGVGNAGLLKAAPPKDPSKEFKIDLTLYAHGKRRKAGVSAGFEPGLHRDSDTAYSKLNAALHEFCQHHMIDVGEL